MDNKRTNTIFAAILVAGLIVMFPSFLSDLLFFEHHSDHRAYVVDVSSMAEAPEEEALPVVLPLLASADVAKGEAIGKACAACHSFDKGGATKVGPNLWNVVNGPKAHIKDFKYSDGLAGMGGNWDYESLNHFLYKPAKYITGTKMNYGGLKKVEDRAHVIAWLRTLSDAPANPPTESDIQALNAAAEAEESLDGAAPAAEDTPAETAVAPPAAPTASEVPPAAESAPVVAPVTESPVAETPAATVPAAASVTEAPPVVETPATPPAP